jgi:hypothetical protein
MIIIYTMTEQPCQHFEWDHDVPNGMVLHGARSGAGTKYMSLYGQYCHKPLIPRTVQGYFWHARPRSDATHVKRPDHSVRSEVVSSSHHQDMRWQVCHIITTSSPQCRTAFLHKHLVWYWTDQTRQDSCASLWRSGGDTHAFEPNKSQF